MPWARARSSQDLLPLGRARRNAACEITAEHQLGMAVAELGGGAEPALRRDLVGRHGQAVAAA